MNEKLGHPDFLGLHETVSLGGMSWADEEEGRQERSDVLDWSSTAGKGKAPYRSGGGEDPPGDDHVPYDWRGYDPGPDGIVGTEDDIGAPTTEEEYQEWFDNYLLPTLPANVQADLLDSQGNTISHLGGRTGHIRPGSWRYAIWFYIYGMMMGMWDVPG